MQKAEGRRQKAKPKSFILSFCLLPFAFCLLPFAFCLLIAFCLCSTAAAQGPAGATIIVLPFETPAQEPRLTWMREGAAILLGETLAAAGGGVVDREGRVEGVE